MRSSSAILPGKPRRATVLVTEPPTGIQNSFDALAPRRGDAFGPLGASGFDSVPHRAQPALAEYSDRLGLPLARLPLGAKSLSGTLRAR
jgi:hypothetical protein